MTGPIEPIRKSDPPRRGRRSEARAVDDAASAGDRSLPVPVVAATSEPPPALPPADGAAVFAAQLIGQDGQKRGLRGGPATLDAAKSSYARTEWSGAADRRARRGGAAKTEI